MNKLLIALCLTVSFGASAEMTDEETIIMANHNYEQAMVLGVEACETTDSLINSLGGDADIRALILNLCITSQESIRNTTITKYNLDHAK